MIWRVFYMRITVFQTRLLTHYVYLLRSLHKSIYRRRGEKHFSFRVFKLSILCIGYRCRFYSMPYVCPFIYSYCLLIDCVFFYLPQYTRCDVQQRGRQRADVPARTSGHFVRAQLRHRDLRHHQSGHRPFVQTKTRLGVSFRQSVPESRTRDLFH